MDARRQSRTSSGVFNLLNRKSSRKRTTKASNTALELEKKMLSYTQLGVDPNSLYGQEVLEMTKLFSEYESNDAGVQTPPEFAIEKEFIDTQTEIPKEKQLQSVKLVRKNIIERADVLKESHPIQYRVVKLVA